MVYLFLKPIRKHYTRGYIYDTKQLVWFLQIGQKTLRMHMLVRPKLTGTAVIVAIFGLIIYPVVTQAQDGKYAKNEIDMFIDVSSLDWYLCYD